MNLRGVEEILPNTRVILRMDLDVPISNNVIEDDSRLKKSIDTIKILLDKGCKVAIIGHRGRPKDKEEELSLRPVYVELMMLLEPNGENMIESVFVENIGEKEKIDQALASNNIVFLENLRYWKGEENNDSEFLKGLVEICNFYINDAFAVAHRKHRSIMLYKDLPGFYGISFIEEVSKIAKAIEDPQKPITLLLGGAKEDKLQYVEELAKKVDHVLIGGKLPLISDIRSQVSNLKNVIWAELREDEMDLSDQDIEKFKAIISSSKTIIWAGAMGWFEKDNAKKGTEEIAKAIANVSGYKIIAGGDTGNSVANLGLTEKFDYVCSGGGVMLEWLAKGKLPAWE